MTVKCIVGLGNPGAQYRETRHNAGFLAVEYMIERFNAVQHEGNDDDECFQTMFCDAPLLFLKPQTYMNLSGIAVRDVMHKHRLRPEDILIIYDDFQIPFGTVRIRPHGSDGGHNGIASVIEHLETEEIPRLRIGVGGESLPKHHSHESMADYVLSRFNAEELELLPALYGHVNDACAAWVLNGIQRTMSRYNKAFFSSAGAE